MREYETNNFIRQTEAHPEREPEPGSPDCLSTSNGVKTTQNPFIIADYKDISAYKECEFK